MTWVTRPESAMGEITRIYGDVKTSLANDVYNSMVISSPRLTGAYKSNHNATEGSPDYSFDKNKTTESFSPFESGEPFSDLYIANGAPYAEPLENEHSQQFPSVYAAAYNRFVGKV